MGLFVFFRWWVATRASWADHSEDWADIRLEPWSRADVLTSHLTLTCVPSRNCPAGCWAYMGTRLTRDLDRVASSRRRGNKAGVSLRLLQGPTPRSWCGVGTGEPDTPVLLVGTGKRLSFQTSCCLPSSPSLWGVLLQGRKAAPPNQVSQTSQPPHKEGREAWLTHPWQGGTWALEYPLPSPSSPPSSPLFSSKFLTLVYGPLSYFLL